MINATAHKAILEGYCVVIEDSQIVYAGPLNGAPPKDGNLVLLNPVDFEKLKAVVDQGRH